MLTAWLSGPLTPLLAILNTDREYSSGILAPSQLISISKPDLLFWDLSYMNWNNRSFDFIKKSTIKLNWYQLNVQTVISNEFDWIPIEAVGRNMHRQGNCAGLNLQYKFYRTFQITLQNVCYPENFNCNSQEKKLYNHWLCFSIKRIKKCPHL